MLIFIWFLWPVTIPIAIGSVLLGALGLFTGPTGSSQLIAAVLAVLF
ncbi:MAG TPA: hypothetical protein VEG44_08850 [Candidatus Acidoferrales bacterium]|nr:hypothetical protein [Candidatus Acidoferrales bacterium]